MEEELRQLKRIMTKAELERKKKAGCACIIA